MTLVVRQREDDKQDYMREAVAYLNKNFRTQEDMEQRIGIHLLDFATRAQCMLDEPSPGQFVLIARGA